VQSLCTLELCPTAEHDRFQRLRVLEVVSPGKFAADARHLGVEDLEGGHDFVAGANRWADDLLRGPPT
jgi:hypothetical protein